MKKIIFLIFLYLITFLSCLHDTDTLITENDASLKDIIMSDIISEDMITTDIITDVILYDTEGDTHRDISEPVDTLSDILSDAITDITVKDIYEDVLTDILGDSISDIIDISDISPEDFSDLNIVDITDISNEDITDTYKDVGIDALTEDILDCPNSCNIPDEKKCITYEGNNYVVQCLDKDNDGCFYWEQLEYCKYGCENAKCKDCVPNCSGKECGSDGCGGSCGYCNNPPANKCNDSNYLIVYNQIGECKNDKCLYQYTEVPCTNGCDNGVCKQCIPNCINKDCGPDGCGGSCGQCNSPLKYCNNGVCACLFIECGDNCCDNYQLCYKGSCCESDCDGKQCGSDGCGGSCGECPNNIPCMHGICIYQ